MRQNLLRADNQLLSYPIREVVEIGKRIERLGHFPMIWENIGDPVAAGEEVPDWLKNIVKEEISHSRAFAYTESRGAIKAREYVLENFSSEKVCTVDDILFFNGLGEAINKILDNLPKEARVLVPAPTYPSHATAESLHAGCGFISYSLDPENGWEPDLEEIENKVKYNDQIVAILVINPNNPTGAVFKRETLEKVVDIARRHDCFLIFDEIYHHMTFEEVDTALLYEIIGDVPGLSMKGISKDIPWPGSRCGWVEVYNIEKDDNFGDYIKMILLAKMLEVCSTAIPQLVLPKIYANENYLPQLESRTQKYKDRADEAYTFFKDMKHVRVTKPQGVFYLVLELLDLPYRKLQAKNKAVRLYLDELESQSINADFQFSYELMGAEGVCVVPLTGFGCDLTGFRMTLLQQDDAVFTQTLQAIGRAIEAYYAE